MVAPHGPGQRLPGVPERPRERFLYVGDDRLSALNEEVAMDLFFEAMPGSSGYGRCSGTQAVVT